MFMLYFESNQDRQMERTALCWPHIYSDILQNAPLRRQIFKIVFASGGKGALTPNQNPADVPACKWLALFAADVQINIKYFLGYGVLWRCWLGGRKGIRPVKTEWLSVWSEVQTCIWPSWCHCHSLSLASVKSRLVLTFWYRLNLVVPDKGPLNGCSSSSSWVWRENCLPAVRGERLLMATKAITSQASSRSQKLSFPIIDTQRHKQNKTTLPVFTCAIRTAEHAILLPRNQQLDLQCTCIQTPGRSVIRQNMTWTTTIDGVCNSHSIIIIIIIITFIWRFTL